MRPVTQEWRVWDLVSADAPSSVCSPSLENSFTFLLAF